MRFAIEELESRGNPHRITDADRLHGTQDPDEREKAMTALVLLATQRAADAERCLTPPTIEEILFGHARGRRRIRKRSLRPVWIC